MDYAKLATEIRKDIIQMVYAAQSGHPGGSLSIVEMLIALYYKVMKNIDPKDPHREDRDRFILSKGHCCPALYAVLAEKGYFPKEDLVTLRKFGSHLQGHADMNKTPGVDCNGGSLGQGAAIGAGMALAAKHKKADYRVFVIIGDGESQEGLVWEAAMSAAHYKLDNLVFLLDHNGLQIDGPNDKVMSIGDMCAKFEAFGWAVEKVNGHDIDAVAAACENKVPGKPKFICCETIKGKGVSFMENNVAWHGKAPGKEDYEIAMKELEVC